MSRKKFKSIVLWLIVGSLIGYGMIMWKTVTDFNINTRQLHNVSFSFTKSTEKPNDLNVTKPNHTSKEILGRIYTIDEEFGRKDERTSVITDNIITFAVDADVDKVDKDDKFNTSTINSKTYR